MRTHLVIRYLGIVLLLNSTAMLAATLVSVFNGFDSGFHPLFLSTILTAILGIFPLIFVSPEGNLSNKESYMVVVGSWAACCLMGQLPYLMWGGEFNLVNSWFEIVSGYTTTGSTVLSNVEALPKSLLFWRSSTHLIGGVGVIIFALVILPGLGRAKISLTNVEISILAKENFNYRVKKTVRIILMVYAILIILQTICLRIAGMNWFDSVNHAFSTAATGGFSTRNLSISYYNNVWIEFITAVFMVISGLHFGLLYATFTGKSKNIFNSEVSRYFLTVVLIGAAIVSLNLWLSDAYNFRESFRYGSFQFISRITTTGFFTADPAFWPPFSIVLLICASIQCACSGSTSGGLKSDRVLILFKSIKARFLQLQHPNAVIPVRQEKVMIDPDVVSFVLLFIALYLLSIIAGTLILTAMGIDLMTSVSAVISSLGNVGPGFGKVSDTHSYSALPEAARVVCSFVMLLGRLELFGFIRLFFLRSWK